MLRKPRVSVRASFTALRRIMIWTQCVLMIGGVPFPAAADSQDGSTAKAARDPSVTRGQSAGVFNAAADAFTGAAQLTYPIEVAPGTNGAQPTLALRYSSSDSTPSWVGKGWSLDLGSVQLSLKRGVPKYSATDVFTLNGEELVPDPVDPRPNGSQPTRFRTRRESYQRIDFVDRGFGDQSFEVRQPDGTLLRYGATENSRVRCNQTVGPCQAIAAVAGVFPIFQFALESIETPDGNIVRYDYYPQSEAEGDIGRLYPREIRYTLRRTSGGAVTSINGGVPPQASVDRVVRFVLEPRADPRIGFEGRFERRMTKRLARIDIVVAGQVLRAYQFNYSESEDSFASLLTRIDLLGTGGTGTPRSSTFTYSGNRPMACPGCPSIWMQDNAFRVPDSADFIGVGNSDGGVREADMDVDGITDLVRGIFPSEFSPDSVNGTYVSSPTGFRHEPSLKPPLLFARVTQTRAGPFVSEDSGTILTDFTGDGRPDQLRLVAQSQDRLFGSFSLRGSGTSTSYQSIGFLPATQSALVQFMFVLDGAIERGIFNTVGGGLTLAELNGDGRPDLIQASFFRLANSPNDGYAISEGPGQFSGPRTFTTVNGQPSIELRDRNYFICHALAGAESGELTMAQRIACSLDGAITTHAFDPPVAPGELFQVSGGEPKGKRFYDVNGDGLDDFQSAYAGFPNVPELPNQNNTDTRTTILNNGTQFERQRRNEWNIPSQPAYPSTLRFEETSLPTPFGFQTFDRGLRLVDINADSIPDLVVATDPGGTPGGFPNREIYLGTQSPARPWRRVPDSSRLQIPDDMSFTDARAIDRGVRVVDVSGDRAPELLRSDKGIRQQYRSIAVIPDLLTVASTPEGGTQTFEYSTSARQRKADGSPKNPGLHLNMPVVSRVTVNDLSNPPVVTTFEYQDGLFDAPDREFRGFGKVRAVRAADGRVTETTFHQDIARAGLVSNVDVKSASDTLLLNTQNRYTDTEAGMPFVRLLNRVDTVEPQPGFPRITRREIEYQRDASGRIAFGRVAAMIDYGLVNPFAGATPADFDLDPSDNRTMELEYTPVDPTAYITDRVSVMRLRAGLPGSGEVVREMRMAYDGDAVDEPPTAPQKGLLTTTVAMLDELDQPDPTTTFTYDAFGNMKSVTSPRANAEQGGGTTTMDFDSTFQTFMVKVTNPLGHATQLFYTPDSTLCPNGPPIGLGLVYAEQGPNDTPGSSGTRAVRCYDRFGRATLERASGNLAQTTTEYVDTPGANQIITRQRVSATASRETFVNLDGFGRMTSMVADGPQGKGVAVSATLDAAGRAFQTGPPVFFLETGSEPTRTFYDPLDRVIRVERPSAPGSPSTTGLRTETSTFTPGVVTTTDANNRMRRRTLDPFGNVVKIEEMTPDGTFTTTYAYDTANNLTRVTDHAGNVTTIDYDRLGRRRRIIDPDTGTKTFAYDANGNVVEEAGPSGTLTFEYDVLDRLRIRSVNGTADRTVTYDTATLGIGLPATVTDGSGAGTRTSLTYDALGRELSSRREIDGFRFDFATSFDSLGAPLRRTLPNGTVYTRLADTKGFTTGVASGTATNPTQNTQISGVEFDPAGRITRYESANGTVATTSFEQDTQRLSEIQVMAGSTVLERCRYGFDKGDRITTIDDLAPSNRDQRFQYDALNRLTQATGPYATGLTETTLHYRYSPIGNLTCLDGTAPTGCPGGRTLTYPTGGSGVARPHAPTTVNGNIVAYTPSGNLQTLGTRRYTYDAFERLTQVEESSQTLARFTYTSSGERIKSVDTSGPRPVTQYLLSDDFDFDATRKLARIHIALGSATVATLTQPYAPTPTGAALLPAVPAPFPAGPVVATLILLLALLGLGVQLAQRHRRGQALTRPALASGLVLALWIASVPSSAWALPLDGDLNADGRLDGADALIALEIAQGRRTASSSQLQSGDVAPLGSAPTTPSAINPADALLILRGAQNEDVDGDGLASQAELTFGSSPFKADTDGDGMADLTEFLNGTNPRDSGGDADGDGLSDAQELANGTDPFDRDTDGDGLPDSTDPEPLRGASFLHADQLGSTMLVTGANATVIQRVAYRPYGATVAPSSGPAATPRFGFTGQRFEVGIGIYDYKARFYDPTLGRFLQPDSIVPDPDDPQSLNRYAYVLNSPLNRVDPSGNAPMVIIGGLVVGGGGVINVVIDAFDGGEFTPVKSFTVGAASTLAGIVTGFATANPFAGGAAGGFVGTVTESALNGEAPSAESLVTNTAFGAVGGKLGQKVGQGLAKAAGSQAGEALVSAIDSGLKRTVAIRDAFSAVGMTLRSSKTVGTANVSVTGLTGEVIGVSGEGLRAPKQIAGSIFAGDTLRTGRGANDAEAKILDTISSRIDESAQGTIDLFIDNPNGPCETCTNVIGEFRKRFPNIDLRVTSP
jgi:RHS repeat-associated protein